MMTARMRRRKRARMHHNDDDNCSKEGKQEMKEEEKEAEREAEKRNIEEDQTEEEGERSDAVKRSRLEAGEKWVCEIQESMEDEEAEEIGWDDVRGGVLRAADVAAAMAKEMEYMVGRKIWKLVPLSRALQRCWASNSGLKVLPYTLKSLNRPFGFAAVASRWSRFSSI